MWPLSTANGYKRYYASSSVATNTSSLSAAFQKLSTQMGPRSPDWRWPQAMNSVISINYKRAQQQMHYFQMGSGGIIGSVCCDPTCDNEILQTSQFSSNSKPCQSNCIHNKTLYLIQSRVSDGRDFLHTRAAIFNLEDAKFSTSLSTKGLPIFSS